jgi:hypothetical protein
LLSVAGFLAIRMLAGPRTDIPGRSLPCAQKAPPI